MNAALLKSVMEKRRWTTDGPWLVAPREDVEGWLGESRFNVGFLNAPTIADAHNRAMVAVANAIVEPAPPSTTSALVEHCAECGEPVPQPPGYWVICQTCAATAKALITAKAGAAGDVRRHRIHIERADPNDPASAIVYVACPPDPEGAWVRYTDVRAASTAKALLAKAKETQPQPRQPFAVMAQAVDAYAEFNGPEHDNDCPGDDTCECGKKWLNDGVNAACRYLHALAMAKAKETQP